MASIRLTVYIKAADKGKNKIISCIEAKEGVYIKEINDMEETREQDFSRKNTMSIINQAVGLLNIPLKNKKGI